MSIEPPTSGDLRNLLLLFTFFPGDTVADMAFFWTYQALLGLRPKAKFSRPISNLQC